MINVCRNGIVTMNKGDDIEIPLFINQGTKLNPIRFSLLSNPNAELYLGIMMPHLDFECALVRKKYTFNSPHTEQRDVIVELKANDTRCLVPGRYYIEAKLRLVDAYNNERIFTVMPKLIFLLLE